jgi:hypothetical protein
MKNVHIATYQDRAKKLADAIPEFDGHRVVVRLGGTMPYNEYDVQINSVDAIKHSIDKRQQKHLMIGAGLKTLPILPDPQFPCVVKGRIRSCGTKVFLVEDKKAFAEAVKNVKNDFYIEPFFEATSEYRLHCTQEEVFFAVKKIKRNAEDVMINHQNHFNKREFLKPRLWEHIKAECVKAMKTLNLDIACFDVLYSSKDNNNHQFVIAEANTNPEMLNNTFDAYKDAIIKVVNQKIDQLPAKPAKKKVEAPKPEPIAERQHMLTDQQKVAIITKIMNNDFAIGDDEVIVKY